MFKELFNESVNKSKFDKILKNLSKAKDDIEGDGMELTDEIAFEIARETLRSNKGLDTYIKKIIGAKDVTGWLANQI